MAANEQVYSEQKQTSWWGNALLVSGWRHALKVAVAACFCYAVTHWVGIGEGWWAAITSIVVMQSDIANTLRSCRDRLVGTAIGALLGWPVSIYWHNHVLVYAAAVAIVIVFCNLIRLPNAGRLGGVALSVIVLIHFPMSPGRAALSRFLEVALGIVVALAVHRTIFPGYAKPVQREDAGVVETSRRPARS